MSGAAPATSSLPESGELKLDAAVGFASKKQQNPDPAAEETFAFVHGGLIWNVKFGDNKLSSFDTNLGADFNLQVSEDFVSTWQNSLTVGMSERLALQFAANFSYRNLPALNEMDLFLTQPSAGAKPIGKDPRSSREARHPGARSRSSSASAPGRLPWPNPTSRPRLAVDFVASGAQEPPRFSGRPLGSREILEMPSIWLIPVDSSQKAIRVDTSGTLVGRDAACTVQVNDPSVSRRHAILEEDRGNWVLSDQKSANGTWLDGQRVNKAYLSPGQSVRFGAVSFSVSAEEPSALSRVPARPPVAPQIAGGTVTARPGTPPSVPPPPVNAPSAGGMGPSEAAEILGVRPGASRDEVRQHYQKIYNDFQIRLTNAPTAALKRMYQKNLQDLKTAADVLAPGLVAELKA